MLRAAVLAVPLLLALPSVGQAPVDQQGAERLLAEAKAELAPDRRTVVFDVTAKVDGDRVVLRGEVHDAALKRRLLERFAVGAGRAVADELVALPDPALGGRTRGVVCVSVANLRSKPGHAQELGTQVLLGTPLRILKQDDGWYYVQAPNDYLCWTNDRVELMTEAEFAAWQKRPKVIVTDTFAVVRRSPDAASRPVSDAVAGCLLAAEADVVDGCYRVGYADGREGFLPATAAAPFDAWLAATAATEAGIVATAQRFVGVPYLWGGTSCKGMDCSGYTHTVYYLNGLLLPRDASQQVHVGAPVEIDAAMSGVRAGDLLFFGSAATAARRERVTHVGISLGGARFIHASTDVHENSLDPADPDYSASLRARLLHVRRVLGVDAPAGVRRLAEMDCYRTP